MSFNLCVPKLGFVFQKVNLEWIVRIKWFVRVVNLAKPIGLGPWPTWVRAKKAHRSKKPNIKEIYKAKNPTKALWAKANPWDFFLNLKNILLNFSTSPQVVSIVSLGRVVSNMSLGLGLRVGLTCLDCRVGPTRLDRPVGQTCLSCHLSPLGLSG